MVQLLSIRHIACLAACVLLASPANAAPVETPEALSQRGAAATTGKRIILWETSLAPQMNSKPALKNSANLLASSTVIHSITNWDTKRPAELTTKLPFRPMVRTPQQLSGTEWNNLISTISSQKNSIVHFYNEPELNGISAADAVAKWRSSMLPLRQKYGAKLVAPGISSAPNGATWLQSFMGMLAANEKPDYLNLHFYTLQNSASTQEVQYAKTYFTDKHNQYKLPIIVGEIASINRDGNQVVTFTKQMSSWFDGQSWIAEYGFFGVSTQVVNSFVSPAAQMLDANGNWTPLGKWWIGK
ncbi:glycoside hydrolase family 128 protein [Annulohypoxylon maeteangense]|uniref:glycoside hydrolase family 128 protein n=1 Tax=Annulohypoxylon maeteangense TaxID=1927788 RepID=UPI002008D8DA|nr:glycoside hydrolase family 128 protein [Annulohypoxylon maeteangense]KAI0886331.1 glycoside hydrolase family 128 protein [Annulohypoxylon maeteangense]